MVEQADTRTGRPGAAAADLPAGPLLEAWQEHRAALVRYVGRRVESPAVAEDIVHDVLLRALERRAKLRDDAKLVSWLHQMTRNAIVDHYRSRRQHDELPEELPGPEPEPSSAAELARCLAPLVAELPERYRVAVELAELQGLTQRETADRLGVSLSGAKSRVQRGRAKLQELLLRCCRVELGHRNEVLDHECRGPCAAACDS